MKCKNCRNLFKRRDDDGTLYDWCGMIVDCPDIDLDRNCKYYQPASNADMIRAMDDEELVEFFCDMIQDCRCNNVPCQKFCAIKKTCEQAWLDWLKEEGE